MRPDMISANRVPFSGIFPREVDFLSQSHWLLVSVNSISIRGTHVFRELSFIAFHFHAQKEDQSLASQSTLQSDMDTLKSRRGLVLP